MSSRTDSTLTSTWKPAPRLSGYGLALLGLALAIAANLLVDAVARIALISLGIGMAGAGLYTAFSVRQGAGGERLRRAFDTICGSASIPVMVTDLKGTVLVANALAGDLGPGSSMDDAMERVCGLARDAVNRLARRALLEGVVVERLDGCALGDAVVVNLSGEERLVWHLIRCGNHGEEAGYRDAPFLYLRLDRDGRILAFSGAPARDMPAPERLEDILDDLPLRPGGVHRLRRGGARMRCHCHDQADGVRELFLFPAGDDARTLSAPDRFLDHVPVGLVRMTREGELIFVNRAARALLGERAVPGARIGELIEGLGRSLPERLTEVSTGRVGPSEIARARHAERELYLQVALNRLIQDGEVSVIAVISDQTELKSLEAQFVQSQKMQAVGQLAGGVAHDFNNLLTAINGHCDLLLLRHEPGDSDHGDLVQIRQNANRAAALVRQLLAFSRKQTLRPKILQLGETLSELSHLLNRLLGAKVTLRIDNGPDLWPVRVDERQFEQVVMNLVVNARDAMPSGGEVEIRTRNLLLDKPIERDRATIPAGKYVLIEVSDTGVGIPEDRLAKIFEPFFTTKKLGEGTGLGLSTAYGIIKQTGGFIFATSEVGQGTTFSIYLPRHDPEQEAAEPVEPVREPVRDLTGQGGVLLVEDEAPVRSFAARALRLRGYTVLEAESGEEALEIMERDGEGVDLLISDVVMPGIDGPSWVRKARESRPDLKVIFVSGYAEDVFRTEGGEVAGAVFMAKPFSLNELTQKVKEVIEG